MARKYAVSHIPGLKGVPATTVGGLPIPPGDPLPVGTTEFTLDYWYFPTPVDVAAGATPGERIRVVIPGVSVNASNAQIRQEILRMRKLVRDNKTWGT